MEPEFNWNDSRCVEPRPYTREGSPIFRSDTLRSCHKVFKTLGSEYCLRFSSTGVMNGVRIQSKVSESLSRISGIITEKVAGNALGEESPTFNKDIC